MTKYCPSCGNDSSDVINYCWNCGQYLGKGKVPELETKDSAEKTRKELGLEKRSNLPKNQQFVEKDANSIAVLSVYGILKEDLQDILKKNSIDYELLDMPGVCKSKDAVSKWEVEQRKKESSKAGATSTYGSSYYYEDPSIICCYYGCAPRYSCGGGGSRRRKKSDSCDGCSNFSSSSDAGGALIVILIVLAIIAILIFFAPTILATGLIVLDLVFALALLLFNIITLGVYKDDLSRTRVRIKKATNDNITNFTRDLANKRGIMRIPGYWTTGFIMIRYGALFFITGLIFILLAVVLQPSSRAYYYLPGAVIVISIAGFILGHQLINKKVTEIKRSLS